VIHAIEENPVFLIALSTICQSNNTSKIFLKASQSFHKPV